MEDSQTPGSDVVSEYFENDPDGNLYKLQPWFEFDDVARKALKMSAAGVAQRDQPAEIACYR